MNKNFIFRMLKKNKFAFISTNAICLVFISMLVALCIFACETSSDSSIPNWLLFTATFITAIILIAFANDTTIKTIKNARIERNKKFKIVRKFRDIGIDLKFDGFANFINNSDINTLNVVLYLMEHNYISHQGEN